MVIAAAAEVDLGAGAVVDVVVTDSLSDLPTLCWVSAILPYSV